LQEIINYSKTTVADQSEAKVKTTL